MENGPSMPSRASKAARAQRGARQSWSASGFTGAAFHHTASCRAPAARYTAQLARQGDEMRSYWMQVSDHDAVLELREVAQPEPGAGQILVRLHAAALNRGEFIQ